MRSMNRQARHLRRTAFDGRPGLPRLQVMIALAATALSMSDQPRFLRAVSRLLDIELVRQILPDGVYMEQATCYQRYTAEIYLHFIILAARNDEYEEIVDKCEDFLRQVQKEYDENHFTYAELEENEVDLVKLKNWFVKIVERDVFGASGRAACEQFLEKCELSLEAYAARVYAEEAEGQ